MNEFDVVEVMKNISGLMITCPCCEESFTPKQTKLFDIRKPLPRNISSVIDNDIKQLGKRITHIDNNMKKMSGELKRLSEMRTKLKKRKIQRPKEIQVITQRINIGQIIEKILPATNNFRYETKDCRTLLNPIDYISFNGLTAKDCIEKISFIEVKTGKACIQKSQRQVKEAIEAGDLEVRLY